MGEKPRRIQLSRRKGWRMPENTVKVDRSTRWGNPFVIEHVAGELWDQETGYYPDPTELRHRNALRGRIYPTRREAAEDAVHMFREDVASELPVTELQGKNLACWCPIILHGTYCPCHADVLISLANDIPLEEVIRENTRRAKGETL